MIKPLKKISKYPLILLVVLGWMFSGWPQVFNLPSGIQEAKAANVLSSIQTVTGATGAGASTAVAFAGGTALNKMFHSCSFSGDVANALHDQTYKSTALTGIGTLTITAGQPAGGNQSLTYRCYIVIFTAGSDLVVNRYNTNSQATPRNVAITAVSATNRTFVIPHGENEPTDTTIGGEELWRYRLTSTTNVEITVAAANNSTGGFLQFEVVDWNNADIRVQHLDGTVAAASASGTIALTSTVVLNKTWLITTFFPVAAIVGDEQTNTMSARADLQDVNTVRLRRTLGGTNRALNWTAQVIEDVSTYGLWLTQLGNINMPAAGGTSLSNTLTLAPAVNTANTFVAGTAFPSFAYSGASPDTTTGNADNVWSTVTLTNSTTITAVRGVSDAQTLDIFVQAVEFLPGFDQSAYRWFNNLDSTNVGAALAALNTPATLGSSGAAFRLRSLIHVSPQLGLSGEQFKLQFVGKGTGTCAAPTGGTPAAYTDVTAATVIAFSNNATPADGVALAANASDPTHGADTVVNQTYEELNNFTNSVAAIPGGQDGKWDFALIDNTAPAGATYCFRAVKSDGTALRTYTVYPEIATDAINHFSISHAGSGVACVDQTIAITAHDATHNPVRANGLTVALSTTNSRGTWTGIVAGGGALSDPTPGDGAATYTFAAGSNSVQLSFRYANLAATSETFGFNVSGGGFSETTGTATAADDPSFTMAQAGFQFRNVTDGNTTIPTQIAGKPSNTGFNAKTIRIQAIRTDTVTGSCTGLFASQARTVDLGAECNNPTTCAGLQVSINGGNIATSNNNGGTGAAAYTGVSLTFNASSEADTVIAYPDAGQISLHARFDLDPLVAGFEMTGSSNAFVVRPFGLAFPGVTHGTLPTSPPLAAAGDNFSLTVTAYRWASLQDGNNDGVPDAGVDITTGNGTTPNFAATATVDRSANLPGTALGTISRGVACASANTIALSGGTATAADWCYSEVGNVFLTASVSNYISAGVNITGDSGLDGTGAAGGYVGRFRPKQFALSAGALTNRAAASPACAPASTFSYMNERLDLAFTLTAQNTQNGTTQNYNGAYATLAVATIASLNLGARSGTTNLTSRVDLALGSSGSWTSGAANVAVQTGISRATPDNPDGPYPGLAFGIAPVSDAVTMNTFDLDVDGVGGNDHTTVATSVNGARFGRLRLQNALGSELIDLPIPMVAQYWNGSTFVTNPADSCTSLTAANLTLGAYAGGITGANLGAPGHISLGGAFASGVGSLKLTKPLPVPSSPGSATVTVNLTAEGKSYLRGNWGVSTYTADPSARAGFGLFSSQPRNFIFYRENY